MSTMGPFTYYIDGEEFVFPEGPPTGAEIKQRVGKPNALVSYKTPDGEWIQLPDNKPVPYGVEMLKVKPMFSEGAN